MFFRKLLEGGLGGITDVEQRRHVIFSNLVYLIIGTLLSVNVVLFWGIPKSFAELVGYTPVTIVVICTLAYLLNLRGWHRISRTLFISSWFILINLLPVIKNGATEQSYVFNVFYLIVFSPVIHLFFSYQREKILLIIFLSISFLLTFFYSDFLMVFDSSTQPAAPFGRPAGNLRVIYTTLWVFLNLLLIYVMRINQRFYREILHQKEIIEEQQHELRAANDELATNNEELMATNEELLSLNEQVRELNQDLEGRVNERTHELLDRNQKLTEYAFINAHLLRAPVSRIQGLINLFRLTKDEQEKEKIEQYLFDAAEELDRVVHTIRDKLNAEGKQGA
jgi:signal transduction histidine kinase